MLVAAFHLISKKDSTVESDRLPQASSLSSARRSIKVDQAPASFDLILSHPCPPFRIEDRYLIFLLKQQTPVIRRHLDSPSSTTAPSPITLPACLLHICTPAHTMASPGGVQSSAALLLGKQFKQMQTGKDIPGISCGLVGNSVFDWEVMLMLSEEQDSLYGGGIFRARMTFPPSYPLAPPKLKFETPLFHPNVYESGDVCISILHPPEEDQYGYESLAERWSPVQTPETILLSVISMLGSPNDESPANIEAGKLWRVDQKEFKRRVRRCVRDSQENAWE